MGVVQPRRLEGVSPERTAITATVDVFVAISHRSLAIAGCAGALVAALLMVTGCGCRGAFPAVAAHTAVISAAGTLLLPALFPVSP